MIFDFIGTLTDVKNYNLDDSMTKLYKALAEAGFDVDRTSFLRAYDAAHEKYRMTRYQQLVEVTNAIWISEALNTLGFATKPDDSKIRVALNVFFEDYINSFELRPCARKLLQETAADCKTGLISNFTYAPVIYAGLRRLEINGFLRAVLVSDEVGWRKPHVRIFEEALKRLQVKASETVYVGDSPMEDIKGAADVGMRTVFVPSQFYSLKDLQESQQKPDLIVKDLCELQYKLPRMLDLVP
jgi:putative hydrolase of the HAD superfamily